MKKVFDVVGYCGKDKNDKAVYKNVGVILEDDKGYKKLKLNHLVTPDNEGKILTWFNLFEPRDSSSNNSNNSQDDSDIPW